MTLNPTRDPRCNCDTPDRYCTLHQRTVYERERARRLALVVAEEALD